jgi:hypothetical protein
LVSISQFGKNVKDFLKKLQNYLARRTFSKKQQDRRDCGGLALRME